MLQVRLLGTRPLRFDDGSPVRAASAVAPFGDGWLVAQDDAIAGAWLRRSGAVERLPLLPPVGGHQVFSEAAGTKRLKPDLEAACAVVVDGRPAVLLLGSGSLPNRRHGVLVRGDGRTAPAVRAVDLGPLYDRVRDALDVAPDHLNLEGACVVGEWLRWFQRGLPAQGVPSASVDLPLAEVVAAVVGDLPAGEVAVGRRRRYRLGDIDGVGLAVTDAVTLPDGRVLVSAGAEDTADAVEDGAVSGSAVALLDAPGAEVSAAVLPAAEGAVLKLEGLALADAHDDGARLLGVVDQDDPDTPSLALDLEVRWR